MKLEKEKVKGMNSATDCDSSELNIEELTEVQGGIEDGDKDVPVGSCGLGCYLGAGADEPTGKEH